LEGKAMSGYTPETFKQYCDSRRAAVKKEYSTPAEPLTVKAVLEMYPNHVFWQDYLALMRDFAQEGGLIPATVLDSVWAEDKAVVMHWIRQYPSSMPKGYINPEARAIYAQQGAVYTPKGNLKRSKAK
jgi:hypothetical protein